MKSIGVDGPRRRKPIACDSQSLAARSDFDAPARQTTREALVTAVVILLGACSRPAPEAQQQNQPAAREASSSNPSTGETLEFSVGEAELAFVLRNDSSRSLWVVLKNDEPILRARASSDSTERGLPREYFDYRFCGWGVHSLQLAPGDTYEWRTPRDSLVSQMGPVRFVMDAFIHDPGDDITPPDIESVPIVSAEVRGA